MTPNDPRYPDGSAPNAEVPTATISALQLLVHMHHHLRQKVAVAAGLGQLLLDSTFGFTNEEQQAAIRHLRAHSAAIEHMQAWIEAWMKARVDQNGNWLSDEYGSLPSIDQIEP